MREKTNGEYPKILVWENVNSALSSNNGDDFKCVLDEFCGLVGDKLPTARPERWTASGEILGESYSLAWRTFDAQYWGVPQRRRRIFLVMDFRGQSARNILFVKESLRRHSPQSEEPWKSFARKAQNSIGSSDSKNEQRIKTAYGICSTASNCMKSDNPDSGIYEATVAKTLDTSGTNPSCNQGGNVIVETVYCLGGKSIGRKDKNSGNGKGWKEDIAFTLTTCDLHAVAYSVHENQRTECRLSEETAFALTTGGGKPGQGYPAILKDYIVRRLTPLECERLQGFPDNWTAGESDSARYKALGNSVAIPCVSYIMSGIADVLEPLK